MENKLIVLSEKDINVIKNMLGLGASLPLIAETLNLDIRILKNSPEVSQLFTEPSARSINKRPIQNKHVPRKETNRVKPVKMITQENGHFTFDNISDEGSLSTYRALVETTGVQEPSAACGILSTLISSLPQDASSLTEQRIDQTVGLLYELDPQDGVEGVLCSQMIIAHEWMKHCSTIANNSQTGHLAREQYLLNMQRFMKLSLQQVEALNKYRHKGTQTVTVQHVTVNDGGQAVVGKWEKQ